MAASRMCHGVTKSGSPTPREITSGIACTMSKNSRMPERGISRTWPAMNCCGCNCGAMSPPSQKENHRREKEKASIRFDFRSSDLRSFRVSLLTSAATRQMGQRQQRVNPDRQFAGDLSFRIDEITRGRTVGLIHASHFHLLLEEDRTSQVVFAEELAVLFRISRTDKEHQRTLR